MLSKREKNLGIVTGAVMAMVGLYFFVIEPYQESLADLTTQQKAANDQLSSDQDVLAKQQKLMLAWNAMRKNGLDLDTSAAQRQTVTELSKCFKEARVQPDQTNTSPRTEQARGFDVVGVDISGSGSSVEVAALLYAVETESIPMRISGVTITSHSEGQDYLSVQLEASTLCKQSSGGNP